MREEKHEIREMLLNAVKMAIQPSSTGKLPCKGGFDGGIFHREKKKNIPGLSKLLFIKSSKSSGLKGVLVMIRKKNISVSVKYVHV